MEIYNFKFTLGRVESGSQLKIYPLAYSKAVRDDFTGSQNYIAQHTGKGLLFDLRVMKSGKIMK